MLTTAESGKYVPAQDHQFLLIRREAETYFGLRVSSLCQNDLKTYVNASGVLQSGLSGQLTWIGSTFHFTIKDTAETKPTMVFTFYTGVVLRNPPYSDNVEGRAALDFRIDVFKGPHLTGSVFFFVLPRWIGELLELERTQRGSLMVSMWAQKYSSSDDESEGEPVDDETESI